MALSGKRRTARGGRILVGTSSWSERSLVHESGWYPRRSMKAAERIAYYAERFDLVEIDATARFPPTPELCRQWVARTPPGFTLDVQAWALLTGAAALPDSLWEDLRDEVRPEFRERRRLYRTHLTGAGLTESWSRFHHALAPLRDAGRLGSVLLRYPHWLRPGATARSLMLEARAMLPDLHLAVELANPRWLEPHQREDTLAFLEDSELGFVCVDTADEVPVLATTTDLAMVRFAGRRPTTSSEDEGSAADDGEVTGTWDGTYRYSPEELAAWVPRLRQLAAAAQQVHVLFANAYRDHAVANAAELHALL